MSKEKKLKVNNNINMNKRGKACRNVEVSGKVQFNMKSTQTKPYDSDRMIGKPSSSNNDSDSKS